MKAILVAAAALAGCTTMDGPPGSSGGQPRCDAAKVQDLVGRALATHQAEAKQRANAAIVRAYESGSALTMDYREDRLNIETDASGTIVKLSCG